MVGNIYSLVATYLKVQALKSSSTFNPEVRGQNRVREAIAKLIQQPTADHIVVGDQETAVMFAIYVVRQQWVYNVDSKIFPVEPGIHLLLRSNHLVNACIEPVCIRWNRNECLVIDTTESRGQVRKRIVRIQERRSKRIDVRNGKVRIGLSRGWVSQHRISVRSAWKGGRERTQISSSFECSRHRVLLRL